LSAPPRRKLLVLNQYYHPGVEATAHLLTELCESLVPDWEVTVITGRIRDSVDPDFEVRNGVSIVRVHSTAFDRAPLHRRVANYFTYLARALRRGLVADRPDVVLCMTDPPIVGNIAQLIAMRFRCPLVVISQDIFPETATRLRRLRQPAVVALLRLLISFALRHATRVVAIGTVMRERLIEKGVKPSRIVVIPNWADTDEITPRPQANPWSLEHGLAGRFVVMHSGNVGHAQNLDVLIQATSLLDDVDDLQVVIVGTGARHAELVELAGRSAGNRILFLPYQDRVRLSESLSSATVHFIGLPKGLAGYVVPSRINGILAVGRPIIAAVDLQSETAALVYDANCGIVTAPDDPIAVADAIRSMAAGQHDLESMGASARRYAERKASRSESLAGYRQLLADVVS
jgi:colanic acid biosynthesis glycosyl transferase WcaI